MSLPEISPDVAIYEIYPRSDTETFWNKRYQNPTTLKVFYETLRSGKRPDAEKLLDLAIEEEELRTISSILRNYSIPDPVLLEHIEETIEIDEIRETPRPKIVRALVDSLDRIENSFHSDLYDYAIKYVSILYFSFMSLIERSGEPPEDYTSEFYKAAVEQEDLEVVQDIVEDTNWMEIETYSADIGKHVLIGRLYLPALENNNQEVLNYLKRSNIPPTESEQDAAAILGIKL